MFSGRSILITGGTGTLGKKIVEIICAKYVPEKLIVLSRDEWKQSEMAKVWSEERYPFIRYFLGDVRDRDRLMRAFSGVDYVIHAAALKQIPAGEYNPSECIKTNVIGAMNVIDAAIASKVSRVVALSTDKACNPVNLYGATKLCSDKLFIAAKAYSGFNPTSFAVVRYGNVIGSRGSVVPHFEACRDKGEVPVTDERMTRFWITVDQAAHFVLFALQRMEGGEIFVPKIPSMKIVDLAEAIAPGCPRRIIGLRPGEKIHETLITSDDASHTHAYGDYFVVKPFRYHYEYHGEDRSRRERADVCPDGFSYSSDTNDEWITIDELRRMVTRMKQTAATEPSRWPQGT